MLNWSGLLLLSVGNGVCMFRLVSGIRFWICWWRFVWIFGLLLVNRNLKIGLVIENSCVWSFFIGRCVVKLGC